MTNLLTTPEVASILRVHRTTVWHLWREGQLKEAQILGSGQRPQPLFDRHAVEEFAQTYTAKRGPRKAA